MLEANLFGKKSKSISGHTEFDKKILRKIFFDEGLIIILLMTLLYHGLSVVGLLSFDSFTGEVSRILLISISIVGVIPVIISAVHALRNKTVTVDLLASIALIFTLIQGEWVSAAFINLMLSSARLFSSFTERKTENIISHLLKLKPLNVKIQNGEHFKVILLSEVRVNDVVIVESGDRIPIDGVVVQGQASVDQSTLTGESMPVAKASGDQVFSSTLCISGSLFVQAQKVGENTTLSKIIKLVDEASRAKTKTEAIANKFSAWYIFITLFGVVIVYFFSHNTNLVLGILLVVCADDLAVAIPLGFTVAISKAARHGIVVKGSAVMERLKDIHIIVTDKTGTLTKGSPVVTKAVSVSDIPVGECINAAAICSMGSKHPSSRAILECAKSKGEKTHAPDEFREYSGEGVFAKHDGTEFLHGKMAFLKKNGVEISESIQKQIREEQSMGGSISFIAINKKIAGYFVLVDEIRMHARESIEETHTLGVKKWVMLTGDNELVASRVAKQVGIDEFHANLSPHEKLEYVKKLKHSHGDIAMIGDGVNDAASLAIADVSFAMGAIGSDTSIEAADIALMHDDLRRVPETIYLSKKVLTIVKENFIIWGLSNSIGLYLVFSGLIGPSGASLYNFLTDFFPILNVFRIYSLKIDKHTYEK